MATLTINKIVRAGLVYGLLLAGTKAMVTGSAADEFANNGRTFVLVSNDDAEAAHAVVFATQRSVLGLNVAELIVSIPLGMVDGEDAVIIGPFPPNVFNDANGKVQVTYTEETDGSGATAHTDFGIIVFSL